MRSLADRFAAKWVLDRFTGCWLWTGYRMPNGYGRFGSRGGKLAHRWAYQAFRGDIADGLVIDHLCRVRACVNPWHMRAVTPRENLLAPGSLSNAKRRADQTSCQRGHSLDGCYRRPDGRRECRACGTERAIRRRSARLQRAA